ncbi:MAG: methyltransferase domain-containing protein [Bacteroidota bacterium]
MFNQRSYQAELLDDTNIPKQDLFQNLRELHTINTWLGGHQATLKALKKLCTKTDYTYRILDVGCGGGDTLKVMADWGRKNNIQLKLVGVDLKQDCIEYASAFCADYPEITFERCDYRDLNQRETDIVVTSLFCHHLHEDEIIQLIGWSKEHAKMGMVINDLHRHPFAYYSIALLTSFFSKSYLVKHDAKLSVLRGFSLADWKKITSTFKAEIKWCWAFRWLVMIPS